jgi:hypothetical protein
MPVNWRCQSCPQPPLPPVELAVLYVQTMLSQRCNSPADW